MKRHLSTYHSLPKMPSLLLAVLLLLSALSMAQTAPKSVTPKQGPVYLTSDQLSFLDVLPPFPAVGSEEDAADVATLKSWRRPADSPRFQQALTDDKTDVNRFNEAYGSLIDAAHAPLLYSLLGRVRHDVSLATGKAKHYYHRQRPFERLGFNGICWNDGMQTGAVKGDDMSYPSGHNSFAWSTVLTLAAVAPERAQTLLARGVDYGESRMVCGVHYPSDVLGGKLLATSVFTKLQSSPLFQRDLRCARQERAIQTGTLKALDSECQQLLSTVQNETPRK
jgi:acid phosphatase (class A)